MKHGFLKLITTAALFLAAVVVSAQNKSAGINLSLWNKVSTQPILPNQKTYFNLGLVSVNNMLNGLSVNLISNQVDGTANGVQVVGLLNVVDESLNGIQVSGLANVTGEYSNGISVTGLANIIGESQHGIAAAGLLNMIGIDSKGLAIAGLGNMSGYNTQGLAIGGVFNFIGTDLDGVALAGLLNLSKTVRGVNIAGLANISNNTKGLSIAPVNVNTDNFHGLQLGVANINTNKHRGVQLGIMNIGAAHRGLQMGLINYYSESLKGFQFGLINLNRDTKISMLAYGGNRTKMNLAARFKNDLFYNIIGVGTPVLKFKDKFSGSINYRSGMYYALCKNLEISGDLGFQHVNTFKNKDKSEGIPKRMYSLQARANIEVLFNDHWSLIATGGYETMRWYSKSKTYRKGALVELGLAYTL